MFDFLRKIVPASAPNGGRPPVAAEITPQGILAGVSVVGGQPSFAWSPLPEGAVAPSTQQDAPGGNLPNAPVVIAALKTTLDQLATRTRAVTLIVPDAATRVFLLDFDTLPHRLSEAIPVLRFRLRKMLPFDAESAAISYQILSEDKQQTRVLVVAIPGPVLAEYEAVLRAANYEPGAVLPSSLAALSAVHVPEAVITATLSTTSLTTAIISGNDLLLYRTLELPAEPDAAAEEIRRSISVASAFYEDRLQLAPTHLYYSGMLDVHSFTELLGNLYLAVMPIASSGNSGFVTTSGGNTAPVLGALNQHAPAGAAA